MKHSNVEPTSTTAYYSAHTVHMAALACPYCGRGLLAYDVEPIDKTDKSIRLICPGCHRDLLVVEVMP